MARGQRANFASDAKSITNWRQQQTNKKEKKITCV